MLTVLLSIFTHLLLPSVPLSHLIFAVSIGKYLGEQSRMSCTFSIAVVDGTFSRCSEKFAICSAVIKIQKHLTNLLEKSAVIFFLSE